MKAMTWVIVGFGALGLSKTIETVGDKGLSAAERLPYYFAALAVLLGAGYCFFQAFRTLFAGGSRKAPAAPGSPRPARRIEPSDADRDEGGDSDFDPDAALARYMAKREAAGENESNPQARSPAATAPPRTPGGFGRRVV